MSYFNGSVRNLSRAVQRRLHKKGHIAKWVDDAAVTLFELENEKAPDTHLRDADSLISPTEKDKILQFVTEMGKPPKGLGPREAFEELQGQTDYS
eukprot:6581590-Karenia_brevis.AAC.1